MENQKKIKYLKQEFDKWEFVKTQTNNYFKISNKDLTKFAKGLKTVKIQTTNIRSEETLLKMLDISNKNEGENLFLKIKDLQTSKIWRGILKKKGIYMIREGVYNGVNSQGCIDVFFDSYEAIRENLRWWNKPCSKEVEKKADKEKSERKAKYVESSLIIEKALNSFVCKSKAYEMLYNMYKNGKNSNKQLPYFKTKLQELIQGITNKHITIKKTYGGCLRNKCRALLGLYKKGVENYKWFEDFKNMEKDKFIKKWA